MSYVKREAWRARHAEAQKRRICATSSAEKLSVATMWPGPAARVEPRVAGEMDILA
jgi:hypothetical protein